MSEGRRTGLYRESGGDRRVITPVRLTAPVPSRFLNTNSYQVCPLEMGGTAPGSYRSGTRRFPLVAADSTGGGGLRLRSTSSPRGIPTASRFLLTRRVTDPGLFLIPGTMAWRPYENLIDGELDNRTSGKVTGWLRFFRRGMGPLKVRLELEGDFHEDVRGAVLKLSNPRPADRNTELDRTGTYMERFCPLQRGSVGDITAGLPLGFWTQDLARRLEQRLETDWQDDGIRSTELAKLRHKVVAELMKQAREGKLRYAYVSYPYIEWYAKNGRVVLELDPPRSRSFSGIPPSRRPRRNLPMPRESAPRPLVTF